MGIALTLAGRSECWVVDVNSQGPELLCRPGPWILEMSQIPFLSCADWAQTRDQCHRVWNKLLLLLEKLRFRQVEGDCAEVTPFTELVGPVGSVGVWGETAGHAGEDLRRVGSCRSAQRAWKELGLPVMAFSFPRSNQTAAAGFVPGWDRSRKPGARGAGFF